MGLFKILFGWLFGSPADASSARTSDATGESRTDHRHAATRPAGPPRLVPLRRARYRQPLLRELHDSPPYAFSRMAIPDGGYQDLTIDSRMEMLRHWGLPEVETPQHLADWLDLTLGQVAWLIHRFDDGDRPPNERASHYRYRWLPKQRGGYRLIEAPKPLLKQAQTRILRDLLDRIPPHATCHGFTAKRSIVTNAEPHIGQSVVVKFDLENFYPSVSFARVVALFRGLGYNREIATWLGRLTTACLPTTMPHPRDSAGAIIPYVRRHLPQGAPTSPMLANLAAFSLDIRLAGLARSFGANYTRYADDLTFSGPKSFQRSLKIFIPLVMQVIRDERFRVHRDKRKILKTHQRQIVTGVTVNQKTNISREQYDRLKAILTNCLRHGPETQNHDERSDFAAHLRGRIAFVSQLNRSRGERLWALFNKIRW